MTKETLVINMEFRITPEMQHSRRLFGFQNKVEISGLSNFHANLKTALINPSSVASFESFIMYGPCLFTESVNKARLLRSQLFFFLLPARVKHRAISLGYTQCFASTRQLLRSMNINEFKI